MCVHVIILSCCGGGLNLIIIINLLLILYNIILWCRAAQLTSLSYSISVHPYLVLFLFVWLHSWPCSTSAITYFNLYNLF